MPLRPAPTIRYSGSEPVFSTQPTLEILPDTQTLRATSVTLTVKWDRAVDGFTAGDISVRTYDASDQACALSGFTGSDGDQSYTVTLTIPDNSTGEVDIEILANVATDTADSNNAGPPAIVVKTFIYNTIPKTVVAPTVEIAGPPDPPRGNTTFPIYIQWSESVGGFSLADITAEIGGSEVDIVSNLVNIADNRIFRANVALPNQTGTLVLKIAANSVQGSQRTGPATEYTKTLTFTGVVSTTITNSTTILEETRTYAQRGGAYVGVLEMLSSGGFTYMVVQKVQNRESTPTDFLAWDFRGSAELLRVRNNDGSKTVLATYPDVLTAPRSLHIRAGKLRFFRGSHYIYEYPAQVYKNGDLEIDGYLMKSANTPDYRGEIGGLYEVDGNTIKEVGRVGRSLVANPDRDAPYNPYFGIHGGMASPMLDSVDVVDPLKRDTHAVAGYGKLSEIGSQLIANGEADRIANWNFGAFTETLQGRVAVLETNGKTGWEVIRQLAILTRSHIGFDGNTFKMTPARPPQAKVSTALTATATTLVFKETTHYTLGSSGYVKIGDELIRYTGLSSGTLTGLKRGFYETTPAAHAVDAPIQFFSHFVDDFLSLDVNTDEETLYNVVNVSYAENQRVTKDDAASITASGKRRELDVELPLAQAQRDWAETIAEALLAEFKDPKQVVTFMIEEDTDIEAGDVMIVNQPDRASLQNAPCVVKEVGHALKAGTTSITALTL